MTDDRFVSYAQNGEDVVLHRVLGSIARGRYIEVGANDPVIDSVSKAFYDAGWRGITIEPVGEFAERHRETRPEDLQVQAAVTTTSGGTAVLMEVVGTGLSSLDRGIAAGHRQRGYTVREVEVPTTRLDDVLENAGWQPDDDIHFMSVDVEGTEGSVLGSIDFRRWRPWVVVVEATRPQSIEPTYRDWEPTLTSANYRFALFDGLSRYYLAVERWDQLHDGISAPANPIDDFVRFPELDQARALDRLQDELDAARAELVAATSRHDDLTAAGQAREDAAMRTALLWRARAVGAWADRSATRSSTDEDEIQLLRHQRHELTKELTAIRHTLSWRITKPIRSVRFASKRLGR